jgi:hypothetical protein
VDEQQKLLTTGLINLINYESRRDLVAMPFSEVLKSSRFKLQV